MVNRSRAMPSQPAREAPRAPAVSLSPIRPADFGAEQARHLLWRAGFGGTAQQIQQLVEWGPEKSVDHLLDYDQIAFDPASPELFDREIMRPPTPQQQEQIRVARRAQDEETLARLRLVQQERERNDRRQMRQIQRWWLKRMIQTPRPLEEKLTLFWHGHFATAYRPVENSYNMFLQNLFFRSNALGSFADLLYGIIRDPAMLAYLDQNTSRRSNPNENLARELMELFSLGVGNYSEQDIREGARALTGHSFQQSEFIFRQREHDPNPKRIFGRTVRSGEDFVTAILEQRACSIFICRKLYHFFVAELDNVAAPERDLPQDVRTVVADLASLMRNRRYLLKPVLRRLFLSQYFYSPRLMNQQIKSPLQLVVGALRSLHTPVRDLNILLDALDLMGQNIFNPPSVKGWDGGRSWINTSTLFIRQNILAYLLTGKRPLGYDALAESEQYDPAPLLSHLTQAQDPAAAAEALLRFTTGRAPADAIRLLETHAQTRARGRLTRDSLLGMLLLITAMPEYQLC
jgi:uncharacterized protein (DUF1800 family)